MSPQHGSLVGRRDSLLGCILQSANIPCVSWSRLSASKCLLHVYLCVFCVCVYACVRVVRIYVYACVYVYLYMCVYAFVYVCVYVCVCMRMCLCTYVFVDLCVVYTQIQSRSDDVCIACLQTHFYIHHTHGRDCAVLPVSLKLFL
jgi:hypothetical protein